MEILHDEKDFIVAIKPSGLLSEEGEGSFPSALKAHFLEVGSPCPVFPVHRLDRAVSGVMVYAKTKGAAAALSSPNALKEKTYYAVVKGKLERERDELVDYLLKDARSNKVFVVKSLRKGVKEARLFYRVLAYNEEKDCSLLSVTLQTGRSHQIRVQLASRKHPIVGDGKYGGGDNTAKQIALFSAALSFDWDNKRVHFHSAPPAVYPFSLFSSEIFSAEK
ncbi:MAG: RNA pseudouridine synthase [Clostridia bacterium]|nr:RNA pseudouridine synthase [Clostridia bacterium]